MLKDVEKRVRKDGGRGERGQRSFSASGVPAVRLYRVQTSSNWPLSRDLAGDGLIRYTQKALVDTSRLPMNMRGVQVVAVRGGPRNILRLL